MDCLLTANPCGVTRAAKPWPNMAKSSQMPNTKAAPGSALKNEWRIGFNTEVNTHKSELIYKNSVISEYIRTENMG